MSIFIPEPHLLESPRGRAWPGYPGNPPRSATGRPPASAEVVIVGAGLAGLAVTSALWHLGVRDVVLLDRTEHPAQRFFQRVDLLGQRVMRSPYEHHPGVEGYHDCELLDFARLHWAELTDVERREVRMAQSSHRSVVPIDVFEAFCRHVATIHGAYQRFWPAEVRAVLPDTESVAVRTRTSEIRAGYVVLCLGEERRPVPEEWWPGPELPAGVGYWDEPAPPGAGSTVVVGAGLTAAHLISNALRAGQRVDWVLREPQERYQCSDVNAAFFRAEGRARFDGVTWADRMSLMGKERRASVMFEFRPQLHSAEETGQLRVHRGKPVAAIGPGAVELADGTTVAGDTVRLAIGTAMANGELLMAGGLVGARDGWPDLDERTLAYRNAPRVFALGAAAGMVLGPAARNIDGHRVGTARVAGTIAAHLAGATKEAGVRSGGALVQ